MKKVVAVAPSRPRDARGRLLPQTEVAKKTPRGKTLAEVFANEAPPIVSAGVPAVEVVLPPDATCVAASPQSGHRYFPCGAPAVALNENQDHERGARCYAHAVVGVKEYGEHIVVTSHPTLLALQDALKG